MTQVVYADVLVVVNIYVNYALLRATAVICKRSCPAWKIFLSALFGGIYSLIILFDKVPEPVIVLSRIVVCALMLLIAFGVGAKRAFLRVAGGFFLVNLVFAGLMLAIWLAFSPKSMIYCSGIVYFNINTVTLVILTILCYAITLTVNRLVSFKHPHNTLYDLTVYAFGKKFDYRGFLDTGNALTEPFSGLPVIIVDGDVTSSDGCTLSELIEKNGVPARVIPCSTVASSGIISAVRPEKIIVKGIDISIETNEVYIGLSGSRIKNGDYTALLCSRLFENRTDETEEDYAKVH